MRALTRFVAATAIVSATTIAGSAVHAQQAVAITVTPTSVEESGSFTVDGTGWNCGVEVDVAIIAADDTRTSLGTIQSSDITGGAWSATFDAPATAGDYTVEASERVECNDVATAALVVTAPPTTTTTTTTTVAPTTTTTTTTTVAPTTTAVTTTSIDAAPVTVLPETGNADGRIAVFAMFALLLGAGFVALARRPRTN